MIDYMLILDKFIRNSIVGLVSVVFMTMCAFVYITILKG